MVPPGPAFTPNGGQPDAMGREDAGVGEFNRAQAMGRMLAGDQGGAPATAMAGRPVPQNGLERVLSGLQDGFDTLTGSPPPDRRAQMAQALGAPPVSELLL